MSDDRPASGASRNEAEISASRPTCPATYHGVPCIKQLTLLTSGEWAHGGGHMFATARTLAEMDSIDFDARSFLANARPSAQRRTSSMADEPSTTAARLVERVAEKLLEDYAREYQADHLTWRDFEGDARALVGVMFDWLDERLRALPRGRDESFRLGFDAAVRAVRDET